MSSSAPSQPHTASTFLGPGTNLAEHRFHLVGIGGCGMSGLAAWLLSQGATISGTDCADSDTVHRLASAGARISTTQTGDAIPQDADVVVVSAAIPPEHPERRAADERGLQVIKYSELLGLIMARFDGIAISGTHGKSTTTAWLTYTLRDAGLAPSYVIGATVEQLGGGSGVGAGPHFVAEACEYARSFLNLYPHRAVVLNIEEDHLDCYKDLEEIRDAFRAFVDRVPTDGLVILNADDPDSLALARDAKAPTITFGESENATWRAANIAIEDGRYAFDAVHDGNTLGRVQLGLPGRHNLSNALAVLATAGSCGVPWDAIRDGLATFTGAHRRLETRGEVGGIRVLDDYAHHPSEIRATLRACRERFEPRRLWCIFQPHQHSRTRFLLADFAASFEDASEVVVPDIYFVRDSQRERELVCAQDLVDQITEHRGNARYVAGFDAIVKLLADRTDPGDVVITMGAGNIWKVADELVQRLRAHLPA